MAKKLYPTKTYEVIGEKGERKTLKTVMDYQEHINSGYYKDYVAEAEVKKVEKVEIDPAALESALGQAKTKKELTEMSVDELQEIHKEKFGVKKRGQVTEETLIKAINETE